MKQHRLLVPSKGTDFSHLQPGDKVLLSGVIHTARDQAHQRLVELISRNESLPFDLANTALFYCGPSPTPPGKVCGAIGPTTSSRMDPYTVPLLEQGLKIMIGKGERSADVETAIKKYGALYLVCCGGTSALLAQTVISFDLFAWPELGAEAIYRLEVKDLPCYVAIR
ncbi:MAG: TRZ/ATZ family protein [Candidatus Cloacimonetes bacterium]|nr:TRZ/ATZ family protein [Candidatus Cloacimonadota bacterium]